MDTLNIGLIGLGYIGQVHLNNGLKLQNAKLTAVADISKNALKRAQKLGIPKVYQDYNQLIEKSGVDAVIIALPTHLHYESALVAAENGKHILLEKPLARGTIEGSKILAVVDKHDVKLMIGHPLRFSDNCVKLKERIDTGELGEVQVAYATNIGTGPFVHRAETGAPSPVPEWWWKNSLTGGGALIDLGSHMIDLARWYFGNVVGARSHLGYRFRLENEDSALCLLEFEQGQICVINVGWFSQQQQLKFEVCGTAGHATTETKKQGKMKIAMQLLLRKTSPFNIPYLKEIQHFVDCIHNDEQPQPSGEDGLKDLQAIETAYANQITLS